MKVEFLEPAEAEFIDAIHFYNLQREGLGHEFAKEIQNTINRISSSESFYDI